MHMSEYYSQFNAPSHSGKSPSKASSAHGLCKWHTTAQVILRSGLGALFVWSGGAKLLDPRHFTVTIESFGLIPDATVLPAALSLAVVEIVAGLGLIFNASWGLGVVSGLLLLFVAVLSYGIWLGLDVDCGCFGPHDPEGKAYHGMRPALYRDAAMLATVGYLYHQRRKKSLYPFKLSVRPPTKIKRRS